MDYLERFIIVLDFVLNTRRKHHITGGILLSMSALLGGLAMTVVTISRKDDDNE